MEERHGARFYTLLDWLKVLLQCTEASILVFADLCGLTCSHKCKSSPDQAASICLLPLQQARPHFLTSVNFRLACLLDVSCNTAEQFFVEKSDGRKDSRLYTRTSSSEETGGSGPDCGAMNYPLMYPRISRQKFSLQRVGV